MVISVKPFNNFTETGKWVVTVKDIKNNSIFSEAFHGVMVCTGHHVKPMKPEFKNQGKFKGVLNVII